MGELYNARPHKGRSLLSLPVDCTIVDIETTGLDPRWDEIIELSAIRIRSGAVVDHFTTLVKPEGEISGFITQLTGISNIDVAMAPRIADVLPDFLAFLGSDIIVGHNIHFDVNFLYDAAAATGNGSLSNDMVDTMRLSRHLLPQLKHHRLGDVADALGIVPGGSHRGLADCETTCAVLRSLKAAAEARGIDLSHYANSKRNLRAADISAQAGMEQPNHPLYGKVCVFTGALERMPRKEAMQIVVNLGGVCGDNVTANTNFLILGNNDYCSSIKDGKSGKQKKAENLILQGYDLQILSESVFYDLIGDRPVEPKAKKEPPRKAATFGCCGRYEKCSDARECVHPDQNFAQGCAYRNNLLQGRIFYGKNKNIP